MKKDPNPSVGVAPADAPAAVPRRRFGRTGLRLPVLSAGFMRAMQSWQDVADEQIDPNSQRTMLAVARDAELHKLKARLILQIHDELVLEAPESAAEHAGARLRALMQNVTALAVPLKVDLGTGFTWAQAH